MYQLKSHCWCAAFAYKLNPLLTLKMKVHILLCPPFSFLYSLEILFIYNSTDFYWGVCMHLYVYSKISCSQPGCFEKGIIKKKKKKSRQIIMYLLKRTSKENHKRLCCCCCFLSLFHSVCLLFFVSFFPQALRFLSQCIEAGFNCCNCSASGVLISPL